MKKREPDLKGPLYIHQNKQLINYLNISNSYIHFKMSKKICSNKTVKRGTGVKEGPPSSIFQATQP